MDLDLIEEKLSEIYNSASRTQDLIRQLRSGKISESVTMTATQKTGLKNDMKAEYQKIKDAITVIDKELGA